MRCGPRVQRRAKRNSLSVVAVVVLVRTAIETRGHSTLSELEHIMQFPRRRERLDGRKYRIFLYFVFIQQRNGN